MGLETTIKSNVKKTERYCAVSSSSKLRILTYEPEKKAGDIVLVPGFLTMPFAWEEFVKGMINRGVKVHYFETREKTSSKLASKDWKKFSLESLVEEDSEVINSLNLESYGIVASSYGITQMAKAIAEEKIDPDLFVMIGPNIRYRKRKGKGIVPWYAPFAIKSVPDFLLKFFKNIAWKETKKSINDNYQEEKYKKEFEQAEKNMWKLRRALYYLYFVDSAQDFERIKVPTLILYGKKDKMHSKETAEKIHEMVQNSDIIEMESNRSTHSDDAARIVFEFLKRQSKN